MRASTIASVALLVFRALRSYGEDAEAVFERAGVDPRKLAVPGARYSYESMSRLWRLAAEASGDPCFGLRAARYWHPTSLHALGYSWMASDSLRDAFERMIRFRRLVSTVLDFRLEASGTEFRLVVGRDASEAPPAFPALDAAAAVLVLMCRTSYGEDFDPTRVLLERPPVPDPRPFEELFRAPVEFSSPTSALRFRKSELETHLLTANPALAEASDRVAMDYLARFDRRSVGMRVRARLIEQLPSGRVGQRAIAESLHMSPRTLQRKLDEEGTSYRLVVEETRRELAEQYLRRPDMSVSEVTYLLGFSEPSNFSRAFRRWTGSPPTSYQRGTRAASVP